MGDEAFVNRMKKLNFVVISGWAGTGKSTAVKDEQLSKKFNIIDLDSSYVRAEYNKTAHSMPFHAFYVQKIFVRAKRSLIKDKKQFPIILISAHQDVIQSVVSHHIPLIVVYPNKEFRYEYLYNLYKRIPDGPIEEISQLPQYRAWKYSIDHIDEMYKQLDDFILNTLSIPNSPIIIDELTNKRYISDTIKELDKTYITPYYSFD